MLTGEHTWVGQSIVSEKTFILPFTHGLFSSTKYLPMFAQAGVKLEFLLNQVDKCILANTAVNAAFEISNVEFDDILQILKDRMSQSGLDEKSNRFKK